MHSHSLHSPQNVTRGKDPPDTATIYILQPDCCFSLLNSYTKQWGFKTTVTFQNSGPCFVGVHGALPQAKA